LEKKINFIKIIFCYNKHRESRELFPENMFLDE